MLVRKITVGFVTQVYDTKRKKWISQEFTAGDQVDFEDSKGNPADVAEYELNKNGAYLPYDMVQPKGGRA